ncbi:LPD38 domain-containing protein [Oxalobacter formigenes]
MSEIDSFLKGGLDINSFLGITRPKVSASDIDYAAAETGGGFFNLPEIMEDNSARKNPIVETVAKAAKAKKARRQVSVAQDFNPTAGNEVISLDDVAAGLNKMVTGGSPMDRINYPDDPYADDFMRDKPSPVDLRAVSSTPQAYNEADKLNTFLSRVAGQTAQSVSGLYRMGLETTGLGNVMPNALGMLEELSKRAEKVQDTRTGYDTKTGAAIGEDAMNVGSSIAQMLMTGVSPYPLTAMGAMTAGQSYDANRNLGVSPGAAALAAGASGLAEGGFERVFGIGEGIQALKGALRSAGQTGLRNAATGAGRGLLNIAAGEEPSELMTTGIQGLADRAVNPFHETSGMNQEMADTARVTAEQAGLLGLLGGGMSMAGRMSARRHQKQVDNQVAQARALQALDPNANPLAEFTAAMKSAREATEQAKQAKPQAKPSDLLNSLLNKGLDKERPTTQPLRQTAPNVPNVPNVPTDVPVETVNQKTPIGAIIANGGINRDVLKKDLGWTDEELARLPQGVVSEKGTGILAARRALKQNGFDTDINAVLDTATRAKIPEENYSSAEYVQSPVVKTASRKSDASPLESGRTWEQERDAEMERDNQYYERLNGLSEKQLRGRLKALKKSKSSEAAEEIGLIHEILSGRPPVEKKEIPDALTRPPINRESFGFNRSQPEKQGNESAKNDASVPETNEQKDRLSEQGSVVTQTSYGHEKLSDEGLSDRMLSFGGQHPTKDEFYSAQKEFNRRRDENSRRLNEEAERRRNSPEAIAKKEQFERENARKAHVQQREREITLSTYERAQGQSEVKVPKKTTPGNRIDQRKYFKAKDGSFVGVVDTGSTKPVMTVIGKNGETKEIPVGKQVRQMVSDGRLVSISKEDFEARKEGMKAKPAQDETKPAQDETKPAQDETKPEERMDAEKPSVQRQKTAPEMLKESYKEYEKNAPARATGNTGTFSGNPDIRFSRSADKKSSLNIEEVQRIADELAQEYENAPELVVVEKASDLPFDAPEDAQGAFRNGRYYLVAGNLDTAEDAKSTFAHEVIGHYGLNGFFGESVHIALGDILLHNKNVQIAARKWIADNQDFIRKVQKETNWDFEKLNQWRKSRATEEALAEMAQRGEKVTGVKKLVHIIQKILRSLGLGHMANKLESITDAEALMALHKAELFVKSGKDINAATAVDIYTKFSRSDIAHGKEDIDKANGQAERGWGATHSDPRENNIAFSRKAGINPDYAQQIDELVSGERNVVSLGLPSKALTDSGIANIRLQITKDTANKVLDKHGLPIDELKALPGLLAKPVMVFKSDTDGGHVVVVNDTAVAEDGRTMPVVVAIRPNGEVSINYIRSVYARRNFPGAVRRWMESGLLVSAQKKTAIDLINLYSQRGETSAADRIINSGNVISLSESPSARNQSDDSIAFSRKTDDPASFSRKNNEKTDNDSTVQKARGAFKAPDITLGDIFARAVQDDNYDLKQVQKAILEQGGVITEKTDAYMSEEAYLGKTKARLEKFTEGHVKPILEKIRDSGVSLDDASQYLLARHVYHDKVNERLKALNPDRTDNEALSGMSDADARSILKEHAGNPKLKELGEAMDALAQFTRSAMLNGGLITDEVYNQWSETYQHYVPLHRDIDGTREQSSWERLKEAKFKPWDIKESGQGNQGAGRRSRGFEVKGQESQRRTGSNLDVSNVIVNAIAQTEGAIIRAEKAKVALSLLDLAKANPNDSFWTVDTPVLKKQLNPETGLIEHVYRDANLKPADNVLVVKEAGRERWIVFNEHNKRAMEIAKKFKNLDAAAMNWAVQSIGDLTRWTAGWLTQKNPIFMFFNFQRDIQHAVFNLSDTPIAGKEGQFLKNVPLAMKGYWDITRSANKDSVDNDFANYAREFKDAGAETGFIKSFESINDRITDVERQLNEMSRGKSDPRAWMAIAGRAVDDYNAIIENGVRLAAYVTARKNGMTIPRAASLAKNITVNFNKRGTSGRWLNALYMFANANIQGNARMLQAMAKSKRARIYAGAMMGVGFMMDMVCSAVLGDDDETGKKIWDEISEFDKERNWIIPISTKKYIKIPLPQGLHILPNIGRMMSELIRTGKATDVFEKASRIALMTADTLSPLGSSGSWLQMAFPSVFRPLVQITENKSFTGSKLYRDDAPFGGYNEPAYEKAFKNTPSHWVSASKMLNYATGGDDVTPGKINVPPEALRLAVTSFVTPGVSSQLIDKGLNALVNAGRGNDLKLRDIPVASRIVGEMPDEKVQERAFYDRMNGWRQNIMQIDEYEKQGRTTDADNAAKRLGDGDLELGNRRYDDWKNFNADLRDVNKDMKQAEKEKDKAWQGELAQERKQLFAEFGRATETKQSGI